MNQNEYLRLLEDRLIEENVINVSEVLEIYRKRFELGHEAEMSDQEIIEMLGSVDSIVKKYVHESKHTINENTSNFVLKVGTVNFEKLDIVESEEKGLHFYYDKKDEANILKYIDIIEDNERLIISGKTFKIRFSNRFKVKITVGPDVFFKDFEIKNTSTDLRICPIYAKNFNLATTSGDIDIDSINAVETEVSSVSGDINVGDVKTAVLRVKNVSGDIDFKNVNTNNLYVSTISGDIFMKSLKTGLANLSTISGDIRFDTSSIPSETLHTSRISGDIVLNKK